MHTDSTNFLVTMAGSSLRVSLVFVRWQFFHMFSRRRGQCFEEIPLPNFGDVEVLLYYYFPEDAAMKVFQIRATWYNVFYSNALPLLFLLEKHNCIVILAFARI